MRAEAMMLSGFVQDAYLEVKEAWEYSCKKQISVLQASRPPIFLSSMNVLTGLALSRLLVSKH